MNESMTSELQSLRARAYGPDADLRDDPAALDRLGELEEIVRRQRGGPPDATAPTSTADDVTPTTQEDDPDSAASVDHADPPADLAASEQADDQEEPPRGRWSARRVAVVLIAAIVMAVVVTATVTGVMSRRVQADPREVAVLDVDPAAAVPEMFGNWECNGDDCQPAGEPEAKVFMEFYGLSAFTVSGQYVGAVDGGLCLMVTETSQMDTEGYSFSGRIYSGCSAGEFPASIQLVVTKDLPEPLRAEFPEGSGLQFLLQDSEVIVLSDVR